MQLKTLTDGLPMYNMKSWNLTETQGCDYPISSVKGPIARPGGMNLHLEAK